LKLTVDWKGDNEAAKKPRLTHIVATIGPKTKPVEVLEQLMETGMDVARLNFSHGTHEYHAEVVTNVREAVKRRGADARCAIMLDTKGPEIRTGKLKEGPDGKKQHKLVAGQDIIVNTDLKEPGDSNRIALDYQDLVTSVKQGGSILIADGQISLTIKEIDVAGNQVKCVVNNTSVIGENKNVHLPGAHVNLPAVSEKDIQDLQFGVKHAVDMIAASFIRSPDDVRQIRQILGVAGKNIKIISKIESTEGLENFDQILDESDGIMVARGDLGVEVPLEQIFIAQKMMISKCNAANKPVITATQMLESMIVNPRPTRAEATDVANAVLDGSDAVMLSGETASGDYPIEAVKYMAAMCKEAERVEGVSDYPSLFEALKLHSTNPKVPEVVCSYAVRAANDLAASLVITLTETGSTARLACKYRPRVPVLCVTQSEHTAHFSLLTRACYPVLVPSLKGTDQVIAWAMDHAKKRGFVKSGDLVVVISGIIELMPGNSNNMRVITVP